MLEAEVSAGKRRDEEALHTAANPPTKNKAPSNLEASDFKVGGVLALVYMCARLSLLLSLFLPRQVEHYSILKFAQHDSLGTILRVLQFFKFSTK